MNKKKLQRIITKLKTGLEPVESLDELEGGIKQLTSKLHKKIEVKSLDSVNSTLEKWRKEIDFAPVLSSLKELKEGTNTIYRELGTNLENRATELFQRAETALKTLESTQNDTEELREEISNIRGNFKNSETKSKDIEGKHENLSKELKSISKGVNDLVKELDSKILTIGKDTGKAGKDILSIKEEFIKLRAELLTLINNIGGGNMNRQIKVGGTDVLTKYTDINLVAGTGITLTTAVDETDKNVDITITSTADLSVTLADVSANSTDTAKSLYTLTNNVDVEFEDAGGATMLYLDESTKGVIIGSATNYGNLFEVWGTGGPSMLVGDSPGGGDIAFGDIDSVTNGTVLYVVDSIKVITFNVGGASFYADGVASSFSFIGANLVDFGSSLVMELPNAAAPTVDAFGEIAADNNFYAAGRGAILHYDGTSATALVGVLTSDTPSDGQVPMFNTGGTVTWETKVGLTETQTLTNKRITKRVVSASDATSVTPNADTSDITHQTNTQATGTLTMNAPTGTPTDGQSWMFRIDSTNVQTFSWNAIYVGGTTALPTATTGANDIDYYTFIYYSADTKWHFTGQATALTS